MGTILQENLCLLVHMCLHVFMLAGVQSEGCAESLQELQSLQKKKLTIPFRERENIAE